jgi:hypothetical protein
MNFYDEAIESKHNCLRKLRSKAKNFREMRRGWKNESTLGIDLDKIIANQAGDIQGLETANTYFWESRITQMVLASGQQLPPDVKFQPSWLAAPSGWWWFGRSSPLVALSKDNKRKYAHALFYRLDGERVHIATYSFTGVDFEELGSTVWLTIDDLSYTVSQLKAACNFKSGSAQRQLNDVLGSAIKELRTLMATSKTLKEKSDWLSSHIPELEAFLTGEGQTAFKALPNDEERLIFLEALYDGKVASEASEINPEETTDDRTKLLLADWRDMSINATLIFACGNLWLQQKIVVTDPGILTRGARRRLERAGIVEECRVVRLRKKEYAPRKEGESEPVDWAWQWAVNGHWRDQPTKEGIKLIWIHPYIKGPEHLPLKPGAERIFAVTR